MPRTTRARRRGAAAKPIAVSYAGAGDSSRTQEETAWLAQASRAGAAVQFWNEFFNLQQGPKNDQPLSAKGGARILTLVRAISWVESRHGTGTGTSARKDPMQCGNPDDFWAELVDCSIQQDRFISGPGRPNFDACELPDAAAGDSDFPNDAKISQLGNGAQGHDDAAFNAVMSYSWGVPIFVHKMNTRAGSKTYQCGSLSDDRLIEGAVAYNGGGDPGGPAGYRQKIKDAIALIGGIPPMGVAIDREGSPVELSNAIEEGLMSIRRAMAPVGDGERFFFPKGIDLVELRLAMRGLEASVRIAGPDSRALLERGLEPIRIAAFSLLPQVSGNGYYPYSGSDRQWGTQAAIDAIVAACTSFFAEQQVEAGVGDISFEGGGPMPPHKAHQAGREADFRPLRKDKKPQPVTIQDVMYSRELTAALVQALQNTGRIAKILFNDTSIPGVTPFEGHDNHLHVAFTA
jgi:hypothetical protein